MKELKNFGINPLTKTELKWYKSTDYSVFSIAHNKQVSITKFVSEPVAYLTFEEIKELAKNSNGIAYLNDSLDKAFMSSLTLTQQENILEGKKANRDCGCSIKNLKSGWATVPKSWEIGDSCVAEKDTFYVSFCGWGMIQVTYINPEGELDIYNIHSTTEGYHIETMTGISTSAKFCLCARIVLMEEGDEE